MSIEAMKQALEALENSHGYLPVKTGVEREVDKAITALRQAIEFAEMVQKGTKAWADTPDDWVDDLRGGAEQTVPSQKPGKWVYPDWAPPETYSQTKLELCGVCGWDAVVPGEGCLNCARFKQWLKQPKIAESERKDAERLQKEPEPVAWMYVNKDEECEQIEYGEPFDDPSVTLLYTAPPKKEWAGLTGEEFDQIVPYCHNEFDLNDYKDFARAIEAKLREKNT